MAITDMKVAGEHAVVTGGATGIGFAIAEMLVTHGAKVTIMGRNADRLAAKAAEISAAYVAVDVTDADAVAASFAKAVKQNGDVSILVNNAGSVETRPFTKADADYWHATLDVNLNGVFYCTKAVVPAMLEANRGRIVNIASTASLKGYAYVSAYCAAKHGVLGLTRSLAIEYAKTGITVNAVCPGYTDTEIVERSIKKIIDVTGRTREEPLAELVKEKPQGRLIQPQEVAHAVLSLLDNASQSITGQAIAVAGGEIM